MNDRLLKNLPAYVSIDWDGLGLHIQVARSDYLGPRLFFSEAGRWVRSYRRRMRFKSFDEAESYITKHQQPPKTWAELNATAVDGW